MEHHPFASGSLTPSLIGIGRQSQAGSLTGAVASQKVTEAPKGALRLVGNQPLSVLVYSGFDCETDKSSRDESRAK